MTTYPADTATHRFCSGCEAWHELDRFGFVRPDFPPMGRRRRCREQARPKNKKRRDVLYV